MIEPAIDALTALELSAVDLVKAAAQVGCRTVGIIAQESRYFPFPDSGLLDGGPAVAELVAASRDLGVRIDCIECFAVDKHCDSEAFRPAMELARKLGATSVNTLAMDRNEGRLAESYARLCDVAAEYGLAVLTEVHRALALRSLSEAAAFADKHRIDLKVELDSLHFFRHGGQVDEITRHANRIARAQLCDGPLEADDAAYAIEAVYQRGLPGSGQLPLVDFLARLPDGIVVALEAPTPRYRTTERLRRGFEGHRALLAAAGR